MLLIWPLGLGTSPIYALDPPNLWNAAHPVPYSTSVLPRSHHTPPSVLARPTPHHSAPLRPFPGPPHTASQHSVLAWPFLHHSVPVRPGGSPWPTSHHLTLSLPAAVCVGGGAADAQLPRVAGQRCQDALPHSDAGRAAGGHSGGGERRGDGERRARKRGEVETLLHRRWARRRWGGGFNATGLIRYGGRAADGLHKFWHMREETLPAPATTLVMPASSSSILASLLVTPCFLPRPFPCSCLIRRCWPPATHTPGNACFLPLESHHLKTVTISKESFAPILPMPDQALLAEAEATWARYQGVHPLSSSRLLDQPWVSDHTVPLPLPSSNQALPEEAEATWAC